MVANLSATAIYCRILTPENVDIDVNYHGIFIALADGLAPNKTSQGFLFLKGKHDSAWLSSPAKNIGWFPVLLFFSVETGNTKGGSITVPLTSSLSGLESALWLLTIFVFICKTD